MTSRDSKLPARAGRVLAVGALFVALTVVMTWPQLPGAASGVRDPGDPLLNTWILAWDVHELSHLDVGGFFDANIFYPYPRTLAFSEHLFPQSLAAAPVIWLSGNPILGYNVVLLLGFLFSALGMYVFARRMTGSTYGAVLAGIVFGFSPFMFDHLSHVQILSAGGIPLTFLFLEQFLAERRWRDVLLFALVFTAQILANGYYALFLSLFVALFLAVELLRRRLILRPEVLARLAVAGVLVLVAAGPFFRQYVLMQKEMAFTRNLGSRVTLSSYLAVPPINRLYGAFMSEGAHVEARLFPGAVALLLALAGLAVAWRPRRRTEGAGDSRGRRSLRVVLNVLIAVTAGFVVWITVAGPVNLSPVLRANHVERPLELLGLFAALRLAVFWRRGASDGGSDPSASPNLALYAILGALAFLFSFGAGGPYELLYRYVPGFDGIRAVSRFHVMLMFVLALLAAHGARILAAIGSRRVRLALCGLVGALMLAEYASFPLPLTTVPVKGEISPVYPWLAAHGDDNTAVLELPLPPSDHRTFWVECPRVYASTYHWRRLVNGFSGFAPPLYVELRRRWETEPVAANVEDLRALGVRYIVVHRRQPHAPGGAALAAKLLRVPEQVRLVQRFDDAWVFEVDGWQESEVGRVARSEPKTLPRDGWKVAASVDDGQAALAIDGDLSTRWDSGRRQWPGITFEVDMGREQRVSGVRLRLGSSTNDYPRGYEVDVSEDGVTWQTVARNDSDRLPIMTFLHPADMAPTITFPPRRTRFVRLTNLKADDTFFWSIHELDLLGPN